MNTQEMMINGFIKLLGISPEAIWNSLEDMRVRVVTFDERLAVYEAQQAEILAILRSMRMEPINGKSNDHRIAGP